MKTRPDLLTHPNIPQPLHGVAPRIVLGQDWWDRSRKAAYARYGNRCWCCGIAGSRAKWSPWLEAHESYTINYREGWMLLDEIVALCHSCHSFIHSGRMDMLLRKGRLSEDKALEILEDGFRLLRSVDLKPPSGAAYLWLKLQGMSMKEILDTLTRKGIRPPIPEPWRITPWEKWHLIVGGEAHYSRFKSEKEHDEYYRRGT